MSPKAETFQFQAESRQVLDLMIHSLYTNKEIFLRELISNASDALDRLRFEALTHPEFTSAEEPLEITIEADPKERTLTVRDNGIGMSREDLIRNLGTIAKSGTRELLEQMKSEPSSDIVGSLIGRFGVGFYSAFMVADRVTVVSQKAGESNATQWESTGDGEFTLEDGSRPGRGTTVVLHLKPVDPDAGIEDYTAKWVITRIVSRYSDFVSYPIRFKEIGGEAEKAEDRPLNSMKPIWTRAKSEVSDDDYKEFYKHLSHDWHEPLRTWPYKAEGINEYQALVFLPSEAPFDLYYPGFKWGLHLYVRRVLIIENCEELLPRYLRFVRGVVDSADLPLNISRQRLQEDRHIAQIRKWLTKRILESLEDMAKKDNETYLKFWNQFGRVLKEGISFDFDNKDRIVPLVLFASSADSEKLTNLREYVDRMKPGQEHIYYLTGETRGVVDNSPHLEAFKERGIEVLYLTDPVDELAVEALHEFEGKALKSVGKGTVELGTEEEKEQASKALKEESEKYASLMQFLQRKLDAFVKEVRLSSRLTSSPACLVAGEMDYSPNLERLLKASQMNAPKQKRILELNSKHDVLQRLYSRFEQDRSDPLLEEYADILLGSALLAEGSPLHDPQKFNQAVVDLMKRGL